MGAIYRIAVAFEKILVDDCPVYQGFLKNSIKVVPNKTNDGLIITMKDYGLYVEFGTPPHIIKAKNKQVLANKKSGKFFGKTVHHPGTRPNPFIRNAIRYKLPDIIEKEFARDNSFE